MAHPTLTVSDCQFLRAFRRLFTPDQLRAAVAARRRDTRDRVLPLWLLLGLLVSWFWRPDDDLPSLLLWLRPGARTPSGPAVYQARCRLGWAPLRWLRRHLLRPLADPDLDPSAFYHGRRLWGIDGSTFTAPDTPANVRTFGRPRNQHRDGGYPLIRVVALCELGTHAGTDWIARGYHRGEVALAARLLRRVPAGSLLLLDRNFFSYRLWRAATAGRFDLLVRVQRGPKLTPTQGLADGSYLACLRPPRGPDRDGRAFVVRVIRYAWTDENGRPQESRLVTTLLDPSADPAAELLELYHRRWEQELALGELKEQLSGRVTQVRATDPRRALAELDGLLLGHWVMREVILRAAREAGTEPVRVSFTGAVRVLRVRLVRGGPGVGGWAAWWREVLGAIGRQRLRPRRKERRYPRVRKCPRSHWPAKKAGQGPGSRPLPELTVSPPPLC